MSGCALGSPAAAQRLGSPTSQPGCPILILSQALPSVPAALSRQESVRQPLRVTRRANRPVLGFSGAAAGTAAPAPPATGSLLAVCGVTLAGAGSCPVPSPETAAAAGRLVCGFAQAVQCVYLSVFFPIGTFKICLASVYWEPLGSCRQ